jgi:hypothetical protein
LKPVRCGRFNPDLFRERLDAIINMRHGLGRLSALMPWSTFDESFGKFFKPIGRPAKLTRLMVGLHHLKHVYNLSDEARSAGAKLRRSGMTGPTFASMRLQAGRRSCVSAKARRTNVTRLAAKSGSQQPTAKAFSSPLWRSRVIPMTAIR